MPTLDAELLRIDLEIRRVHHALADLHVVVGDTPPLVGPRDSLRVARLKERLLGLQRDRARAVGTIGRGDDGSSAQPRGNLH
jgi:hypothetical protein